MTNSVPPQSFSHDEVRSHVNSEKWSLVSRVVSYIEAEISKNEQTYRQLASPNNDQIIQYFATKSELLKLKLMLKDEQNLLISERQHEIINKAQQSISMDQNKQWGLSPAK